MSESYSIPESNLYHLETEVIKLNRIASKLGLDPIVIRQVGESFKTVLRCRKPYHDFCLHGNDGPDVKVVRFVTVEIDGLSPKLSGWNFLATITHEDAGNTIRRVPGHDNDIPESYRFSPPVCDHCHQNRFRTDTYLVRSDDGEVREVGSNCLKDFLGHKDPNSIARFLEGINALVREAREYDEETVYGSSNGYLLTHEYMYNVAAVIRSRGWISRTSARELGKTSTADQASVNYNFLNGVVTDWNHSAIELTPEDKELADATISWARNLAGNDRTDYEHNLFVTLSKEALDYRDLGIAASGIVSYKKSVEREQNKERSPESNWVGEVGKRLEADLTVDSTFETDGFYGVTTIINFHDTSGNRLVWFASGPWSLKAGEEFRIRGTVKNHGVNSRYGNKETVLTRCKFLNSVVA